MWGSVQGGTRNTSQGELNANLIFNWRKVAHLYCGERPCSTDEGTSQLELMQITLSLGPITTYQMVIFKSIKYWCWKQLESVEKLATTRSADSSHFLDILLWAGMEEGGIQLDQIPKSDELSYLFGA